MAEQLAGGNTAIALLANTLVTVFALYVLIETIGPVSGAHFNPVVSMVMAFRKDLARHHLMMTTKTLQGECSIKAFGVELRHHLSNQLSRC